MSTFTDDDLVRLLDEAAASFPVPDDGPQRVVTALEETRPAVPLRQRRWVQALAVAAVVAAAFAGGALLDRGAGSPEVVTRQAAPADEAAVAEAPAAEDQTADFAAQPQPDATLDTLATTESVPVAAAPVPAPRANTAQPPAAAPAPPVQAPLPDGARVVKTGSIALIVPDGRVTPTLTAVQQLATEAGGVVSSGETQESGSTPSGRVTLRVPVERFEDVVTGVRSLDADVRAATTSGRDVTTEYTDVEAQLRTLRAARERFLEILAQTRSIGDVLTVQQRVDEVTGQIDRLEAQRLVLEDQSSMSTLEVSVTEADDPVVQVNEKPDDGLSKAFRDAWDGFTSGVEALVAASGRAVLVLLCAAVALVLLRLAWRVGRRRLV